VELLIELLGGDYGLTQASLPLSLAHFFTVNYLTCEKVVIILRNGTERNGRFRHIILRNGTIDACTPRSNQTIQSETAMYISCLDLTTGE